MAGVCVSDTDGLSSPEEGGTIPQNDANTLHFLHLICTRLGLALEHRTGFKDFVAVVLIMVEIGNRLVADLHYAIPLELDLRTATMMALWYAAF